MNHSNCCFRKERNRPGTLFIKIPLMPSKKSSPGLPVLTYFDRNAEHVVQADAAMKGLGAVLLQKGRSGIYMSRTLTPAEERYSKIEGELLGVMFTMEGLSQTGVATTTDPAPNQLCYYYFHG